MSLAGGVLGHHHRTGPDATCLAPAGDDLRLSAQGNHELPPRSGMVIHHPAGRACAKDQICDWDSRYGFRDAGAARLNLDILKMRQPIGAGVYPEVLHIPLLVRSSILDCASAAVNYDEHSNEAACDRPYCRA